MMPWVSGSGSLCASRGARRPNATEHNATNCEGVLPSGHGAGFQWSFTVPSTRPGGPGVEGRFASSVQPRVHDQPRRPRARPPAELGAAAPLRGVRPRPGGRPRVRAGARPAAAQGHRKLRDGESGERFELRFSPAAAARPRSARPFTLTLHVLVASNCVAPAGARRRAVRKRVAAAPRSRRRASSAAARAAAPSSRDPGDGGAAAAAAAVRRASDDAATAAAPGSRDADRALRVLAIDGGGSRGVIPIEILAELERGAGVGRLRDHFDLIAGVDRRAHCRGARARRRAARALAASTSSSRRCSLRRGSRAQLLGGCARC